MEEKVKALVNDKLEKLNLIVDSVVLEKEGNQLYLRVCLDSENILDIEKIVEATKIIDPILEKENILEEAYILDIYGKSKGSDSSEC